jgi:hypothetical protein
MKRLRCFINWRAFWRFWLGWPAIIGIYLPIFGLIILHLTGVFP